MKFQATVVFEFEHAHEDDLDTRSLELATPSGTPVTLPAITHS